MIMAASNSAQPSKPTCGGRLKQVKVSVDASVATAFKGACDAAGVSMASALTRFMASFAHSPAPIKIAPDYSTRRRRRTAIGIIVRELMKIRASEEVSRDNMPENLQGSLNFEKADEIVSLIDDAIENLESI